MAEPVSGDTGGPEAALRQSSSSGRHFNPSGCCFFQPGLRRLCSLTSSPAASVAGTGLPHPAFAAQPPCASSGVVLPASNTAEKCCQSSPPKITLSVQQNQKMPTERHKGRWIAPGSIPAMITGLHTGLTGRAGSLESSSRCPTAGSPHPRWGNSSSELFPPGTDAHRPRYRSRQGRGRGRPGAAAPARAEGGVEAGDAGPCGFLLTPASADCLIINCISSSNCCSCRWSWTRHHKQLAEPGLALGRYLLSAPLTSSAGCGAGKEEHFHLCSEPPHAHSVHGGHGQQCCQPARGQPCHRPLLQPCGGGHVGRWLLRVRVPPMVVPWRLQVSWASKAISRRGGSHGRAASPKHSLSREISGPTSPLPRLRCSIKLIFIITKATGQWSPSGLLLPIETIS